MSSRYRGYNDSLEVLIDVLGELRAIKELLTPKETKEVVKHAISKSPKGKQHNTTRRSRSMDKPVVQSGKL